MSRRLLAFVLRIVPAVTFAASAAAQVPAGPEFRISDPPDLVQFSSHVGMDAQGGFIVSWLDFGNDVKARHYDAAGNPRGPAFVVAVNTPYIQQYPRLAVTPAGRFLVAWAAGAPAAGTDIQARAFDANDAPRGSRFTVNTHTTGYQVTSDVSTDAGGNFVVVWASYGGQDGSGAGIFGRRIAADGAPMGGEFAVNGITAGDQKTPAVASAGGGQFVVAWVGDDGSGTGIWARRFDVSGNPLGPDFLVNTVIAGGQADPAVAVDGAGDFVVAWMGPSPSVSDIYGQRFLASGARRGVEFRIPTYTPSQKVTPAIAADGAGNFIVTWGSVNQDGSNVGVYAQRFGVSGAARGTEFRVNATTTRAQSGPAVALDQAGNFVVTWEHNPAGGDFEVFGQRFGGLVVAPTVVDATGNRVFEPGETVVAAPAWRNLNGSAQTFSGAASNFTGPGAPNNPTYAIVDAAADYGTVPNGAVGSCTATGNCYSFSIGTPTTRPVLHWDATFREDLTPAAQGQSQTRTLHVGDSFGDVPRASGFYRFVETILHHGLTGGCGGGNFCPLQSTPREQMTVFVLLAKEGADYQPPACVAGAELFGDVPASNPFCRWIEELARRSVVGGCGGGNFCPLGGVSREQMTVFALATRELAGYTPPACVAGAERFGDVPASSPFCRWVEELERRGIIGGCGGGNFCPIQAVTREQNSVFVSGTFGLTLY